TQRLLYREEAAIYCARSLGTALISFGRRGNDILAHLLPKHPRLPAKRVPVELRHALAVVVGHFEVYDRVHFAHDCPPCRLSDTTLQGDLSGILQLRCGFAPGHRSWLRPATEGPRRFQALLRSIRESAVEKPLLRTSRDR